MDGFDVARAGCCRDGGTISSSTNGTSGGEYPDPAFSGERSILLVLMKAY